MDRARQLGALRQALVRLDPSSETGRHGVFTLGAGPVDAALGGGLARGAVHEIFPTHAADIAAAAGFAAGLTLRASPQAPLLWIRHKRSEIETGALYAPGLAEMGLNANQVIVVHVSAIADGLRAGLEGMRCTGLGAVIIEAWGESKHFDLTASRKLALAAQESGVTGILLRALAEAEPSAAATRWQVEAALSSEPLGLPGRTTFSAHLLRQRKGLAGGQWTLEWSNEEHRFTQKALSRPVAAPHFDRPVAPSVPSQWAKAG